MRYCNDEHFQTILVDCFEGSKWQAQLAALLSSLHDEFEIKEMKFKYAWNDYHSLLVIKKT